jgi:serine protease AprX
MNGTSMSTGVVSGVIALMLQNHPSLTPDQVKYRLVNTARAAFDRSGNPVFHTLLQGLGRVWAPDAVLAPVDAGVANVGLDINQDLAYGYENYADLAYHFQGPVRRMLNDDGTAYGYYATDANGESYLLGVSDLDGRWLDAEGSARMIWGGARMIWGGGLSWSGDPEAFSSARMIWGGGGDGSTWGTARMIWGGARMIWGGTLHWKDGNAWTGASTWGSARMIWGGSLDTYATARMIWGGSLSGRAMGSSSRWIDDVWIPAATSDLPAPAATNP